MSSDFVNKKLNFDAKNTIPKAGKNFVKYFDLKQKQCFICKSKNAKKDSKIFGVNYLICDKCSHAFVDKRLSEKALSKYYTSDTNYSSITYANKKFRTNLLRRAQYITLLKTEESKEVAIELRNLALVLESELQSNPIRLLGLKLNFTMMESLIGGLGVVVVGIYQTFTS